MSGKSTNSLTLRDGNGNCVNHNQVEQFTEAQATEAQTHVTVARRNGEVEAENRQLREELAETKRILAQSQRRLGAFEALFVEMREEIAELRAKQKAEGVDMQKYGLYAARQFAESNGSQARMCYEHEVGVRLVNRKQQLRQLRTACAQVRKRQKATAMQTAAASGQALMTSESLPSLFEVVSGTRHRQRTQSKRKPQHSARLFPMDSRATHSQSRCLMPSIATAASSCLARRRQQPVGSHLDADSARDSECEKKTSGRSFHEFPAADRRTATAAPLAPYGAAADRRTPLAPYGAVADRRTALAPFSAATGMPPAYTPSPLTPTPSPEETYASYYPIPSQAYAYQMPVGGQQYADSRRFIGSGPQAFNPSSTPSPAYISSSVASEPVLYRPSIPTYTGINWRRTKRSRQELEEGTVDCTATAHKRRHLEHSRGVVESSVEVDEAIKT